VRPSRPTWWRDTKKEKDKRFSGGKGQSWGEGLPQTRFGGNDQAAGNQISSSEKKLREMGNLVGREKSDTLEGTPWDEKKWGLRKT